MSPLFVNLERTSKIDKSSKTIWPLISKLIKKSEKLFISFWDWEISKGMAVVMASATNKISNTYVTKTAIPLERGLFKNVIVVKRFITNSNEITSKRAMNKIERTALSS